ERGNTPRRGKNAAGDRHAAPAERGGVNQEGGRGISAAGVLARSRGGAVTTPAKQPAGADGAATRRIPQAELERIARLSRTPANGGNAADPGTRTVILPPGAWSQSPALPEKFGYAADIQQHEYSVFLTTVADETRARIRKLGQLADQEILSGSRERGEELRARSTQLRALLGQIEKAAAKVAAGFLRPAVVLSSAAAEADPPSGSGAAGDVASPKDQRSALNGSLPIDLTRRYDTYGGLRAPQAVHQKALEDAVPRDGDGRALRLADPRAGRWFALANAGGPVSDPARALNCVDGVLALFDTYMHARPRVAAPRTFDSYAAGEPARPIGGEWHGLRRIELATSSTFQNLCPYQGGAEPGAARSAVEAAMRNLTNHLHNSGYGSFAFILTDLEGGGCHAWAAVNQDGAILFLDPQIGRIGAGVPLYGHRGAPSAGNVVSMDALVVDPQGAPAPLPYHGAGQWSGTSAA
ncbi:toxin glutamine deamidase domain-containing protein, partial [Paractinoplanes ferrugineus]